MRYSRPLLLLVFAANGLFATVGEPALRLRDAGLAELENEQPARAEEHFRQLVGAVPNDPLPYANLAIAILRQQRFDEALEWIVRALERMPDDPALVTIKGEILQWSGRPSEALPLFRTAAARAPRNVEIQYALLRQASTLSGDEAASARREALERLRELRPDNLVVILQSGQQRVADGDRAAATDAFLRVRELLWQAPAVAETLLQQILQALEADDLAAARVPSLRLENVLKITPMFREGLRELSPGIQGIPLSRFRDEPPAAGFGEPTAVRFAVTRLLDEPTSGRGLAVGDFDGDERSDWARLVATSGGSLEIWRAGSAGPSQRLPAAGGAHLLAADLDNDGSLDLIAHGDGALMVFRGLGDGRFESATPVFGLDRRSATAVVVLDFDIEGDLDLVAASGGDPPLELFRNSLTGPLEPVGDKSLPRLEPQTVRDLVASDLDRDGDVDLLLVGDSGLVWLDNLRQGRFADRSGPGGLSGISGVRAVVSADLDNDGFPDLVTAGRGLRFLRNRGGVFESWEIGQQLRTTAEFTAIEAFDADNDGRLDLAVGGPGGLAVIAQRAGLRLEPLPLADAPSGVTALRSIDLDQDCDLDLIAGGPAGLHRLENVGGSRSRCLTVRLRGLDTGNSKNNHFGYGATIELRAGRAYQFREVSADVTHFGLGRLPEAEVMRVVWSNGVPQNRLQPRSNLRLVEEQVLKGSCPFLYAWNGERIEFVTDLLWGAPIGLPLAPGFWASSDPRELVKVEGAAARNDKYELRITEELWEAAFFDFVRLWVVDHPETVEVASSLRIAPGETVDDRVLATRNLRAVRAWNDHGTEISDRLRARDEIYASPWQPSRYQGVASAPWGLILDLGEAPAEAVRLLLDGWIFPTDASLNLAIAQRRDLATWAPRLEVDAGSGWEVLMPSIGLPAGKTKTMVLDTPPLPAGARRLRIVATQWLSFDRIAWSTDLADEAPRERARLQPQVADLHYRGFSRPLRSAPNAPHQFDYSRLRSDSPWLAFPGRYTRYGDVRELLAASDDRSVILAPGDELSLSFDVSALAAPAPGWRRTVFLESHGWDKDADRNTWQAQQMEPLPFRFMSGYPFADDEAFPNSAAHRDYRSRWLTRVLAPEPGILPPEVSASPAGVAID